MQPTILRIIPLLLLIACSDTSRIPPHERYQIPEYDKIAIVATADTLRFPLDNDSFGDLETWSIRQVNGETIIAFFDQRSESILEYQYPSCQLRNKILLRKKFEAYSLHDAYLQSYDSIFVITKTKFVLVDSSLKTYGEIPNFINDKLMEPDISPTNPPVIRDSQLYLGRYSNIDVASLRDVRKWEAIWAGNFSTGTVATTYGMPEQYSQDYYNSLMHKFSYCVNDKGNFVFSFAADTLLYETDLKTIHNAWNAKSRFQTHPIPTTPKDSMKSVRQALRQYKETDSYGGIYYDPYNEVYLRIARSGTTKEEFEQTKTFRPLRFLILDKHFRTIGESEFSNDVILKQTFFTPDGHVYARILPKNDNYIMFIRLNYQKGHVATLSHEK